MISEAVASRTMRREERGALDIDTVEPRFIYGVNGKIERVEARSRCDAHKLIEECMIAANVAAAKYLLKRKQPGMYRVHEPPAAEKIEALGQFLRELGLHFTLDSDPEPGDFADILTAARTRIDKRLIDTVVLRSLKLAVYSEQNQGHFGLALEAYSHFTSPIRRYPDLLVHRGIRYLVRNPKQKTGVRRDGKAPALKKADIYPYTSGELVTLGTQLSQSERKADAASWDVIAWLK